MGLYLTVLALVVSNLGNSAWAAIRSGTETPLFAEYVNFFQVSSAYPQMWTVKESYK